MNERRLTPKETAAVVGCVVLQALVMLLFGCVFLVMLGFGVTWLVDEAWPAVVQWAQEKPRAGDIAALGGLALVLIFGRLRERRQAK